MVKRTGYAHPRYAESLSEFGHPIHLAGCEGWLVSRDVPGSSSRDAIGTYPVFLCEDWLALEPALQALSAELVTVTVVADPFGEWTPELLQVAFPDLARPYDEHVVLDMSRPIEESVTRHHRKCSRQALRDVRVQIWESSVPESFLTQWLALHRTLMSRHEIRGLRAFSARAFAQQLTIPGVVVARAEVGGTPVGAQIWMVDGDVARGHVLALSDEGYRLGAGYALYWSAFEHFSSRVRWCDIGGVPLADDGSAGGLKWFKRGWSTEVRTAWLCGRVLQRAAYAELVASSKDPQTAFFPAYRTGL